MTQDYQDGISLILARQILTVIQNSGASKVDVQAALGVVHWILPTLDISLVSEEEAPPAAPPRMT